MKSEKSLKEIKHGVFLAKGNPENVWGWGSPAGQVRAMRRAELIIRSAGLAPGMRALEIGCGTGLFTEMFVNTGAKLVAVDISADLLAVAQTRGVPKGKVRFLKARFEDCEIGGPFDAIIGSSVLHHLDLERALKKIYELLEPGCRMVFAEPNMLNPQIFLQKNVSWIKKRMGESPDETAFVRWSLMSFLLKAGFDKIGITPFDWLHPVTSKPFVQFVDSLSQFVEKIPVVREFSGSLLISARRPLL